MDMIAVHSGFKWGLSSSDGVMGCLYSPLNNIASFDAWRDGFWAAREIAEVNPSAKLGPVDQYLSIVERIDNASFWEKISLFGLCMADHGYTYTPPKSLIDWTPETCPKCGAATISLSYEKNTPGRLRPFSYRVWSMCLCGHLEEH